MSGEKSTRAERVQAKLLEARLSAGRLNAGPPAERRDHEGVEALVALASRLQGSLAPGSLSQERQEAIGARVVNQLRAAARSSRKAGRDETHRRVRVWRPAFALAGVLAVIVGLVGTGAAYAAGDSLPGDALYGLKLGLEQARLAISWTTAGDAALLADFADERMAEAEGLAASGRWEDIPRALSEYAEVMDNLVGAMELTEDVPETEDLTDRISHHEEVLARVLERAPAAAQDALRNALERAGRGRESIEEIGHGRGADEIPPGQQRRATEQPPGNPGDNTDKPRGHDRQERDNKDKSNRGRAQGQGANGQHGRPESSPSP